MKKILLFTLFPALAFGQAKISELDALTAGADADEVAIVDKSDTTQAASGSTKKITLANILAWLDDKDVTWTGTNTFGTASATSLAATAFAMTPGSTTIDTDGEIAMISDVWGAGRDSLRFYDGTSAVNVIAALASDTPTNGQVPKWNTGGTITWEDDSTGSGSLGSSLTSSTNDILSGAASSGVLVIGGTGGTNNENLSFDFETTANTVAISTSTGVTAIDTGAVVVDAPIKAFIEKHAASHTLTAAECYGGVYYATAAATLTLPAAADGMSLTVIATGAFAVSVDANAADLIILDGTALDDGDKITSGSTAGEIAVLTYYDATGWYAATDGWSDGGP